VSQDPDFSPRASSNNDGAFDGRVDLMMALDDATDDLDCVNDCDE
jgi:hypothetical protein